MCTYSSQSFSGSCRFELSACSGVGAVSVLELVGGVDVEEEL